MAINVSKVDTIDFITLRKVLTSKEISESQKARFLVNNHRVISDLVKHNITSAEFADIMQKRPLIKFRPLKNCFTKAGDKILLAKTLGIQPNEVPDYVRNITEDMKTIDKLNFLPEDKFNTLKTYVFRHGSKDELTVFLDYELKTATDKIKTLYRTLEYHTGGVADYFIRPIHKLDNNTMIRIYNIIDKHIDIVWKNGNISEADKEKIARRTLVQIYQIQNNNKFINAVKTYKTLKAT